MSAARRALTMGAKVWEVAGRSNGIPEPTLVLMLADDRDVTCAVLQDVKPGHVQHLYADGVVPLVNPDENAQSFHSTVAKLNVESTVFLSYGTRVDLSTATSVRTLFMQVWLRQGDRYWHRARVINDDGTAGAELSLEATTLGGLEWIQEMVNGG